VCSSIPYSSSGTCERPIAQRLGIGVESTAEGVSFIAPGLAVRLMFNKEKDKALARIMRAIGACTVAWIVATYWPY
jgi:hypothetical protein